MFNPFAFLAPLFPCITRERQIRELAIQAQTSARKLSGLRPEDSEDSDADFLSILNSTCWLLERLVERSDFSPADSQAETSTVLKTSESEVPPQPAVIASSNSPATPEPEFSEMAKDLIQLRDWVLMAKTGGTGASAEVIESFYEKLGEILAKEGVTALEESDCLYDYERQQVVSIQVTDDPNKSDWVCNTVRPGYLFQERLIRPQEVVIYTFDNSISYNSFSSDDSVS
ncbi:nucleotide exchange factor GrpE [Planktothrix sp. FACHB-1365]|uniref:nucleotide exchange factor GrpE n=1 Tax=Planktothrix sp. FACHB-1365 TaxID=2692855 RepID=UPI0016840BC9|nr:nucleotide exchange factor GrpE [Planktothrix sp. FACHB-1365]MBD2483942.1 nucleotide exchange factor GrpE [Planktothrix sp. FACHB-1365]